MDTNARWNFNPFDQMQPVRPIESPQQQVIPRSRSLTELRPSVSILLLCSIIQGLNLEIYFWSTTC